MDIKVSQATLELFKSLPMEETVQDNDVNVEQLLKAGVYFTPTAQKYCCIDNEVAQLVFRTVGVDICAFNNFFHKSFDKVANASEEQLVLEQIMHYITTYGCNAMGVFDRERVYIPNEIMHIDDEDDKFCIRIVRAMSKDSIYEEISKLFTSGIALGSETIENIFTLIEHYNFTFDIDNVANKEVRCMLYVRTNTVPKSPTELIRLLHYVATDSTLLVNSANRRKLLQKYLLDENRQKLVNRILKQYVDEQGLMPLARIFFRYKKIILIFKNKDNAQIINAVRRLATKNHIPCQKQILDRITSGEDIDINELRKELNNVTVFKKISLLNGIRYREKCGDDAVFAYKIRTGGLFVKTVEGENKYKCNELVYTEILRSIYNDLVDKVKGKKIYIPKGMEYAFPVSEKSFFGGIPYGSTYSFEGSDPAIVGVHWVNDMVNDKEYSVDLDLHGEKFGGSIGWNSVYRNRFDGVYYSGDMTDAPIEKGGASEALYFDNKCDVNYLITLNHFNWSYYHHTDGQKKEFSFFIGNTQPINVDYGNGKAILSKENLILHIPLSISVPNNLLGFMHMTSAGKKFTFMNYMFGSGITVGGELKENLLKFMDNYADSQMKLNYVLALCGAEFVDDPQEADFDLSLENLSETAILDIILGE